MSTITNALLVSLVALAPIAGCLDAPDGDGADLEANQCNARPLEVIVKGRENRFGLDGQQVALDPAIPIDRICQRVVASCKDQCASAKDVAVRSGVRGFQDPDPVRLRQMGVLADTFNASLGFDTSFSDLGADAPGGGGPVQCNAKALEVIVQGREHRFGFDGRQVALNPAIPMQNICQRVSASCASTCATAKATAEATGIKGFTGDLDLAQLRRMGELADAFNAALGLVTNFRAVGGGNPGGGAVQCNAKVLQVVVKGREHRFGFDGRQVALNPAIPMQNICQQVASGCASTCATAKAAAEATGIKGFTGELDAARLRQMGRLADTFNASLGNRSAFETGAIVLP
jgi:hypothetical protein